MQMAENQECSYVMAEFLPWILITSAKTVQGIYGKSTTALYKSEEMKYNNHETMRMTSFKTVEVEQRQMED
jgi:hypothetical protein